MADLCQLASGSALYACYVYVSLCTCTSIAGGDQADTLYIDDYLLLSQYISHLTGLVGVDKFHFALVVHRRLFDYKVDQSFHLLRARQAAPQKIMGDIM